MLVKKGSGVSRKYSDGQGFSIGRIVRNGRTTHATCHETDFCNAKELSKNEK